MHPGIRWSIAWVITLFAAQYALAGGYTLTVSPGRVLPGGTVMVSWSAPPGAVTPLDWIGVYHPGDNNNQYLFYQFTGGGTTGSLNFAAPVALGLFEFRYLPNNGYIHTAVSNALEVVCVTLTAPGGAKVLMLSGGHLASDCAAVNALADRGLDVTVGPTVPSWNGTQADLSAFVAVLLPHNANWPSPLQEAGITALSDFVQTGGGLVTGEWALWGAFSRGQTSFLALAPVDDYCGFNHGTSTTYTRVTDDPVIDAGLPVSFNFPLVNLAGTESCFGARSDATVFFSSSNGGGQAGADGLVGWSFDQGRVASFSTLLTSVELASADYARLLGNTVIWASQSQCTAEAATIANFPDFVDCLSGPGVAFDVGCDTRDLDCNGRVDLRDVALLQRTFDMP